MKQKIYWYNGWQIQKYEFDNSKLFWEAKPVMSLKAKLKNLEKKYNLRELKFCPPKENEMPCGCKDCTYTDSELKTLEVKHEERKKLLLHHHNMACQKRTMKACKKHIDDVYRNQIQKGETND